MNDASTEKFNYKYFFKIILYFGIIVAAIYLVLIASGYKLDLSAKKFVLTGSIYINSNPKDVNIYLNGRLKSKKAPFKLGYLTPGNYEVKVEREGFKSWQKNLEVKQGLVSYESEIILYYNEPVSAVFSPLSKIKGMKVSVAGNEALYFTDQALYRQKTDAKQEQRLIEFSDGVIEELMANNDLSKIIIKKRSLDQAASYLYCADADCKSPYDLNRGLNQNFDKLVITNDNNYPLLLSAAGNLYSVKNDFSMYYVGAKIIDFEIFGGKIYYLEDLEKGVGILSSNLDGSGKISISMQEAFGSEKADFLFAYDYKQNRLYLIGEKDELFRLTGSEAPKQIGVKANQLNFDNKNFLLITYGSELKVQGKVEIKDTDETIREVARYSKDPINPLWQLRTNHIIFKREGKIKTVELRGTNETDLYAFQQDENSDFAPISKNEILILDQGKITKFVLCDKSGLIDLWQ